MDFTFYTQHYRACWCDGSKGNDWAIFILTQHRVQPFNYKNTLSISYIVFMPLSWFPCRGVSISMPCAKAYSVGLPELSHDMGAQLMLCGSRRTETWRTEEMGINKVQVPDDRVARRW